MKRTKSINLDRMRKRVPGAPTLRPVAVAVAIACLAGCDNNPPRAGHVFRDVAECETTYPDKAVECQNAYTKALRNAASSGPKYSSIEDCVAEFGENNCVPYNSGGNRWFMPAVAGFLFGQLVRNGPYMSSPFYTSYVRTSPMYGSFVYTDGSRYGSRTYGPTYYNRNSFDTKPQVTRTISRGGFGSTVTAKAQQARTASSRSSYSSSRSSSSRSSWGG
ncbi:MAG: DUF1190 domain-containing protein [Pseudomonadota bacterium]